MIIFLLVLFAFSKQAINQLTLKQKDLAGIEIVGIIVSA